MKRHYANGIALTQGRGETRNLMHQPINEHNDIGEVLNKQGERGANDSTEKRIEKLEASVRSLYFLFNIHLWGHIIIGILT